MKTQVAEFIRQVLERNQQPTARELLDSVVESLGTKARWDVVEVVNRLANGNSHLTDAKRAYLKWLLDDECLPKALLGADETNREVVSSIDELIRTSHRYRQTDEFQELVTFIGKFREYAPYNNMLVRVQNPSCGFYATARDWKGRFNRDIKEDARPMLILAPMHPVMLVYDLDQTVGDPLPDELDSFAKFEGEWDPRWLSRLVDNAVGYRIQIQRKPLSSTHGGFATVSMRDEGWKMRIVVHNGLDEPSTFGVLAHEVAHILLGHLGTDYDKWWPTRTSLSHQAIEIEAEAVAWIVTRQLGLHGSSEQYVSRHISPSGKMPIGVSPDMIAKVAGLISRMAQEKIPAKKPRQSKNSKT